MSYGTAHVIAIGANPCASAQRVCVVFFSGRATVRTLRTLRPAPAPKAIRQVHAAACKPSAQALALLRICEYRKTAYRNGGAYVPNMPSTTYCRPEKKNAAAASVVIPANALRQRATPWRWRIAPQQAVAQPNTTMTVA